MKDLLTSAALLAFGVLGIWFGLPHSTNGRIVYGEPASALGAVAFYLGIAGLAFGLVFFVKRWRTASVIGLMLLGGIVGNGVFWVTWDCIHPDMNRQMFGKGSAGPTAEQSREMAIVGILGFVAGAAAVPAALSAAHALKKRFGKARQTQ